MGIIFGDAHAFLLFSMQQFDVDRGNQSRFLSRAVFRSLSGISLPLLRMA